MEICVIYVYMALVVVHTAGGLRIKNIRDAFFFGFYFVLVF